ncbi:Excinuclease ABC C subunit domain protein [uncultured Paludibacter sp.]|uniref:Excinuclease ABC C subunit domain protein n=1 Tax=uncultured Paludibacter sp. TaxID=497635 RepID=A0A653AEF0_9BACT|nr:Excinuclease ABC C subunit domain protein [uncultured Paludibacter sp.]
MKYFVYLLYSESYNRFYKGMTANIEKRLKEQNRGQTFSTKPYKPWKLIYFEEFSNREEARKREKFLKSGQGRDFIKQFEK